MEEESATQLSDCQATRAQASTHQADPIDGKFIISSTSRDLRHKCQVARLATQMSASPCLTAVDACTPHLRLLALVGKSEVQMPRLAQKRGREEPTVDGAACRGQVVRFIKACNMNDTNPADLALYELSPIFAQVVSACDLDAEARRTMVDFGINFGPAALSRIVPAPRQLSLLRNAAHCATCRVSPTSKLSN